MIPKKPGSPKNEQWKVSEGSRSRSREEPLVQIRMDRVIHRERALELDLKMGEDTNRERTEKE